MSNPINYIILEGPDLSGKTTLYEKIHKKTNYQWNIQDRSALSMVVHARLYNRDSFTHVENLKNELLCLNNFLIILLPDWSILVKRFKIRGDNIQNIISLKKVYSLFTEAANDLEKLPNVLVVKKEINENILKSVILDLKKFESMQFKEIKNPIQSACLFGKNMEAVGINFTSYDNGKFADVNPTELLYESEKDYYKKIKEDLFLKIKNEMAGINEYNRQESLNSRRFIYTSDTCISLAHFLIRDNMLDCKYFVRSSNVKDILHYDLNFLKSLSKDVFNFFNIKTKLDFCRIKVVINSAHVPCIIN